MSARSDTRRPKGFVKWRPRSETLELLSKVNSIFRMYEDHLPLTARQIFYRLVGAYGYPKEELAYNRLCEHLVRARRAGMIPFDYIRDDGILVRHGGGFFGTDPFLQGVHNAVENYKRHPALGQPYSIEVWCEAGGMVPQLARVALRYGASAYSTGGFSSVTVTHEIAKRVVSDYRPTVFLHVGDYDPSGVSIYEAMAEDVSKFVTDLRTDDSPDVDFIYERVALTPEQIEEHNLETAPPKSSDSRSESWVGLTAQAEAMPPDVLANTLTDAIEKWYDKDIQEQNVQDGKNDQRELRPLIRRIFPRRTGWRE